MSYSIHDIRQMSADEYNDFLNSVEPIEIQVNLDFWDRSTGEIQKRYNISGNLIRDGPLFASGGRKKVVIDNGVGEIHKMVFSNHIGNPLIGFLTLPDGKIVEIIEIRESNIRKIYMNTMFMRPEIDGGRRRRRRRSRRTRRRSRRN